MIVERLLEIETRIPPSQKMVYSLSGMVRCGKCGGKMIILIETLQPLGAWKNNRMKMTAEVMQKIIASWREKYNIAIVQCRKAEAGLVIHEILSEKENFSWEL